jgi:hypothetical protein
MKLYCVRYYSNSDSSQGSEWFTNKKEAKRNLAVFAKREGTNYDDQRSCVDVVPFELTKNSILDLLNAVAVHPDNG